MRPDNAVQRFVTLDVRHHDEVLWRAFGVFVVLLVLVSCGADDRAGELLSNAPPWGLESIELPDTEVDVAAVIAALPDEIDGRRRPGFGEAEITDVPPPLGVSYGGSWIPWTVSALSADDPGMMTGFNPNPTAAEYVIDMASHGSLGTIEGSALDTGGNLVWAATNEFLEQEKGTAYMMTWARPDGSWAFHIEADSAAGRMELVHAFITAAAG